MKTAEAFLKEMSFDVVHPTGLYLDRKYVFQAMQAYADQQCQIVREKVLQEAIDIVLGTESLKETIEKLETLKSKP